MNEFDDEKFMNQFNNRLNLEPAPKWAVKKQPFPWLEIGWGLAGALLIGLYFTELRFGFSMLHTIVGMYLSHISPVRLFMGLALFAGLAYWLTPKIVREL